MAKYTLKRLEPLVVDIDGKEYKLPSVDELEYEDWKCLEIFQREDVTNEDGIKAYRDYLYRICPALKDAKLSASQLSRIGNAYMKEMGES